MPAKVTLRVIQGPLKGKNFIFDEHTTTIMGRGRDCRPKLPDDKEHSGISRHHCLLEFNPPSARVRDFGSLNGTYVNNERIGKRKKGEKPGEAAHEHFPEKDLFDGDLIKAGGTIFEVRTYTPVVCRECSDEAPDDRQEKLQRQGGEDYVCPACLKKAEEEEKKRIEEEKNRLKAALKPVPKPAPRKHLVPKPQGPFCKGCGKNMAGRPALAGIKDEPICDECRNQPLKILEMLLKMAEAGKEELAAIKGYRTIKELGRGGMGAVYLAENLKNNEIVALKIMLPQVRADKRSVDLFLRESAATKALRHENVVQLMDCGCSDGAFFFTLEYCNGGSVDQLMLSKGGRLDTDLALDITLKALKGLQYAHTAEMTYHLADGQTRAIKGLVHRDVKPQNIFLTKGPKLQVKVADFGLAKSFSSAGLSGMTATGTAAGTPYFMPVQQLANFKYAKPDVDVWAMAASLYNMLTGLFPKNFRPGADPFMVIIKEPAVPILQRNPKVPKRIAEVIDHALLEKPAIGFSSADELARELTKAM